MVRKACEVVKKPAKKHPRTAVKCGSSPAVTPGSCPASAAHGNDAREDEGPMGNGANKPARLPHWFWDQTLETQPDCSPSPASTQPEHSSCTSELLSGNCERDQCAAGTSSTSAAAIEAPAREGLGVVAPSAPTSWVDSANELGLFLGTSKSC